MFTWHGCDIRVVRFRCAILFTLAVLGATGCKTAARRGHSTSPEALVPVGDRYPSIEKPVADCLAVSMETNAVVPATMTRPLEVLVVSGGVDGAPFTSGVLAGWSKSGKRPTFDVVTGISSGAFIGMYAFLGPKYDPALKRLMLSLKTEDLFRFRPVQCLLRHGSIGSTEPAKQLLDTEMNEALFADLRQAHAEGRRFFVGTLCLQTQRLVVWDVGAIASSGRTDADETVRKILLAAFSYPGIAPPVRFDIQVNGQTYYEEHCDAGAVALAFVRFGSIPGWPEGQSARRGWLAGSNLYLLASRKLYPDPAPVPQRALSRGMTALTAALDACAQSQISRIYAMCAASGMRFHMLSMPQDLPGKPTGFHEMFPANTPDLFAHGYESGVRGLDWRLTPPGAEMGEESIPRSGLKFD